RASRARLMRHWIRWCGKAGGAARSWCPRGSVSCAGDAVDLLADEVRMAVVAYVFLDHVDHDPAQGHPLVTDVAGFRPGQVPGVVQRCVGRQLAAPGDLRAPGRVRLVESAVRLHGEAVGVALPVHGREGQAREDPLEP